MRLALDRKAWTLAVLAMVAWGCGSSPSHKSSTGGEGGDETGGAAGDTGGSSGSGGKGGTSGKGGSGGGGSGGSGGEAGGGSGGSAGSGGSGGSTDAGADAEVDAASDDAGLDMATPDVGPDAPPPVYDPPRAPWAGKDIGGMGMQAGGVLQVTNPNNGQNTDVVSSAMGIGGTSDAVFFMYQQMTGAGVVQGRVVSLNTTTMNSAGGLMIRETLDPDSPMVFIGPVGDGSGGKVIIRKTKGGTAASVPGDGTTLTSLKAANGTMLRLVRTGATVKIYAGAPATIETDAALVMGGTADLTLTNPNGPLYYGMAVASGDAATSMRTRFNEVAIQNLASNTSTADWTAYAIATSSESAVWSGTGTNARLTLTGYGQPWGTDSANSRDFLGFAYVRNNDNLSLRFLVNSQIVSDPQSRVSAMVRDVSTLGRSVATVALSLTQGAGLVLEYRSASSATSQLVKVATKGQIGAPLWLRLDRSVIPRAGDPLGTTDTYVTAYYATDNNGTPRAPWILIGNSLSYPTTNANPSALGIGWASFLSGTQHQAEVSKISLTAASPPPDGGILPDAAAPDAGVDASVD